MTMAPRHDHDRDDVHDDVLDELRRALAIAPSEGFEARVQAAVSARHSGIRRWVLRGAVACLASVGVVAVAFGPQIADRLPRRGAADTLPAATATRDVPAAAADRETAAVSVPVPVPGPVPVPDAEPTRRPTGARPERAEARAMRRHLEPGGAPEAERLAVVVPAGRLDALRELVAAIREGQADAPRAVVVDDPVTGAGIGPDRIVIAPVEVPALASLNPPVSGDL